MSNIPSPLDMVGTFCYPGVMATVEFYTINEAASVLGQDRKMVYYWMKQGRLVAYKRYGKTLVRPEDVERLKASLKLR